MSEQILSGRTAIVTGGSQGLGREIARHLLAAGADVAICARSTRPRSRAWPPRCRQAHPERKVLAEAGDIARTEDLDRLFDAAEATFGTIDIVVNNAGIHGPIGPLDTIDWGAWQHAIAVNLNGTVYSCRRAVQHFKARKAGGHRRKIINLSGGGATSPQPGLTAYGASKAGLVRFTETLAEEVKTFSIDINAVAPGALARLGLLNELHRAGPRPHRQRLPPSCRRADGQGWDCPMTQPAELCVYLASSRSDGVTGTPGLRRLGPMAVHREDDRGHARSDRFTTLRRITGRDRGFGWGDK